MGVCGVGAVALMSRDPSIHFLPPILASARQRGPKGITLQLLPHTITLLHMLHSFSHRSHDISPGWGRGERVPARGCVTQNIRVRFVEQEHLPGYGAAAVQRLEFGINESDLCST